MSTFNGLLAEFPDIRVDFFRGHPDRRPPLACFLSHIHSDHLAGLESLRSPFVYCSAASKVMLLRLERFPCRINYAKGILEAHVQRYRHLRTLLKPIPLETPTILELEPGNYLQVTLFDANHCPGAVMFLFEGQGKAALYTGDIRSEPWFVNAIARSPSLVEYSSGIKTIDTVYLDTSFLDDVHFPTKSEGIHELLQKVSKYPPSTIFHFSAWTYGYEDVWIALSKALGSKIHLDEYKMQVYFSLVAKDPTNAFGAQFHMSAEAPALVGFMCGNTYHPGCLTRDESVRLHSCEKGNYCQTVRNSSVVRIHPIVTRLPAGHEVAEIGIGGGGDDLEREAELDYLLPEDVESLMEMSSNTTDITEHDRERIRSFLLSAASNGRKIPLDLDRAVFGENNETELASGLKAIAKRISENDAAGERQALPNTITFPHSRHSSYPELCHLLSVFRPRDVWPCTVDIPRWITQGLTIERLFGSLCSGKDFRHDKIMEDHARAFTLARVRDASQASTTSADVFSPLLEISLPRSQPDIVNAGPETSLDHSQMRFPLSGSQRVRPSQDGLGFCQELDIAYLQNSQEPVSDSDLEVRFEAFRNILNNVRNNAGIQLGLLSTTDNHTLREEEL